MTDNTKRVFLVLLSIGLLTSCFKDDDDKNIPVEKAVIGKWKLVAQLADPRDGSGTFHNATSNKTIEFFENKTIASNGNLCGMTIDSNTQTTGTY